MAKPAHDAQAPPRTLQPATASRRYDMAIPQDTDEATRGTAAAKLVPDQVPRP